MNYKGRLVAFLTYKNEIIEEGAGVKYINREDITEVNGWDESECKQIYERLRHGIISLDAYGAFTNTCIWCMKHPKRCDDCGYGNRHMKCVYKYSLYMRYRHDAISLLDNYKYIDIIRKIEALH